MIKKLFLSLVLCCFIFAGGVLGLKVYENHLKSQINNSMVPTFSITVNEEHLLLEEISWLVPYFFERKEEKIHTTFREKLPTISLEAQGLVAKITPNADNVTFTILNENNQPLFDGSSTELSNFVFEENGTYLLSAYLSTALEESGYGTASYTAQLQVNIPRPLSHSIATTVLPQGGATVITINDVPIDTIPTATSDIGYVRFATTTQPQQYKAVVAVGYGKAPDIYPIDVQVGEDSFSYEVEVTKEDFEVQNLTVSEETSGDTFYSDQANVEFSAKAVPFYYTANDEIYWEGAFIQPGDGRITSPYGVIRYINDDPSPVRHGGVDLAIPLGTPLVAPNHGNVEFAEFLQLTGNTIIIEHGGGLKTYIYHMDSLAVTAGDMVRQGDLIGTVGTTGFSTGPHLHYELKIGRESLNPWPFFDGTTPMMTE